MKQMGRPTNYTDEIGEKFFDLLAAGNSVATACRKLNVGRTTFYNWKADNANFALTIIEGEWFSRGWWEEQGQIHLQNKEFNTQLYYRNMCNRFGWRDKTETDNTHILSHELRLKELD